MLMPPFILHVPGSVEEACEIAGNLISEGKEFDWIAGGTDLIPNYKWHINPKSDVISLILSSNGFLSSMLFPQTTSVGRIILQLY